MNEELLQEIKGLIPWLLGAAIVVGGVYAWKGHVAARRAAASESVSNAYTVEEIEAAASKYGSSDAGGALKLRLAKKYFDAGKYQEALDVYDALAKKPPEGFADVPVVGRAQCLEALGKYAEAEKAFADFAAANPKSYLALTAELGVARTQAGAGDRAKALKTLAALKDAKGGDELSKVRIEATEDCVKRYAAKK